ncbi:MAG: tetratricopeptide repeat protein [Akkermansiaceae bacterium]|nr:tetratricopeptide repeat protein [Akkermansiaceae bacterium]
MAASQVRKLLATSVLAGLCLAGAGCERRETAAAPDIPETIEPAESPALAGARVDLANTALSRDDRDESFALLVSALRADPACAEARGRLVQLLEETRWNLPELVLPHGVPVTRVATGGDSLWVTVGDPVGTTLRWDLLSRSPAAVMFPRPGEETRSLVISPDGSYAVIERGAATLLCRADTLEPIRDIGPLPDFVTPAAGVAFSPDALLVAHPETLDGGAVVWRIRDSKSGEMLRSSEPQAADAPRPLAAHLAADALFVLHADGGLMRMPVSPVDGITRTGIEGGVHLRRALFSSTGGSALVLQDGGPHEAPAISFLSYGEEEAPSLETPGLLERDVWTASGPSLWTGLLHDPEHPWVRTGERGMHISGDGHAPLRTDADLTTFAISGERIVTGEADGTVTIHHILPLPTKPAEEKPATETIDADLLDPLCVALAGCRYNDATRTFVFPDADERFDAVSRIDGDALQAALPELDLRFLIVVLHKHTLDRAAPEALIPMWDRLARADPTGDSWPAILAATSQLKDTEWHQQLAAAVVTKPSSGAADNPWLAPRVVDQAFESGGEEEILKAIAQAGSSGPAAAKALELSLASTHPEWIRLCLNQAEGLPLTLRCLALSRVAWLEDRKADAIASWPDGVPTYQTIRSREDWRGWEQGNFQPALDVLRQCLREELAAIEVPDDPDEIQRAELAARLLDPATLRAVGRDRYAKACLDAALVFAAHKEDMETTLRLAELARNFGADPAPCLRAEAMAYTALGDYQNARDRWVALITEHPVESQLPGDYAEAAYTSFENADPVQAMQILTTGTHRFPNDANFALRAGWVSLLTGNSERAYRFLTTGQRIGYPEEKRENATLLLAIAAAQTGAFEDAQAWYEDLKRLDDDWLDPATIETLEWPEELKASLRQLAW